MYSLDRKMALLSANVCYQEMSRKNSCHASRGVGVVLCKLPSFSHSAYWVMRGRPRPDITQPFIEACLACRTVSADGHQ